MRGSGWWKCYLPQKSKIECQLGNDSDFFLIQYIGCASVRPCKEADIKSIMFSILGTYVIACIAYFTAFSSNVFIGLIINVRLFICLEIFYWMFYYILGYS